ncbi:NAD(P)-dependent oxidoreductase [Streptomyces sp. NPDC053474]|uniref:NAD(P)-dependent oxidoreductase n=1 Tax=Streptomyces sp. NPDC053474 TaxID=3365704 RepID=UPI0037D3E7A0
MPSASSASAKPSVSVLGLGNMGSALAAALLRAGHPTTVWNRTAAKTGPLAAQGATPAETPLAAVAASPLVIACLTLNDHVRDVFEPLAEELRGKTLVNTTNGTPAQARELAAWAAKHDIAYVDAGIMAIPPMIATPGAYILYSGDEKAFQVHRETLAALAETKWVGQDAGLAALWDLSLLTGMYGMIQGVAQAFALTGRAGVPPQEFAPLLADWIVAMTRGIVPGTAAALESGQHLTDVSSLEVNQAAFPNLLAAFAETGVSDELFAGLQPLLDRAVAQGHGADGLSRLAELLQRG